MILNYQLHKHKYFTFFCVNKRKTDLKQHLMKQYIVKKLQMFRNLRKCTILTTGNI